MTKYKVKGVENGFIPGVGKVVNGMIETSVKLEGHNYELLDTQEVETPAPVQAPVPAQNIQTNTQTEIN